jgi:arylsulfatase A-like enzyme
VNLLPFLTGSQTSAPHAALYWRFGAQMAIRAGDFKLVRYDSAADTRSGRGEPVTAAKLYNLRTDLGETADLAAAQPDKVKELQALWDTWNTANVKPLWGTGADPGAPAKAGKKRKAAAK